MRGGHFWNGGRAFACRYRRALALPFITLLWTTSAHAFRTAQDTSALANEGRIAWEDGAPAFSLHRGNLPDGVNEAEFEDALEASLEVWSAVECTTVRPSAVGWTDDNAEPADGRNTIQWVSSWSELGVSDDAPAHADVQYQRSDGVWRIAEADIYLNAAGFSWAPVATEEKLSLKAVLTHEVGHALGLLHPCEADGSDNAPVCGSGNAVEAESTMYPEYSGEQETLAADDTAGICFLYPHCGGCSNGELCVDGECRADCNGELCELGLVCSHWGCVLPGICLEQNCNGAVCEQDRECAPLGRCLDGYCARGTRELGDACLENFDCADGACVLGTCRPECRADSECGTTGVCMESSAAPARGCIAEAWEDFGTTCERGEDCSSGLCLTNGADRTCTSSCADGADCPPGSRCESADGQYVCLKNRYWSDGGCTVSGAGTQPWRRRGTPLFAVALVGTAGVIRRKRRSWSK